MTLYMRDLENKEIGRQEGIEAGRREEKYPSGFTRRTNPYPCCVLCLHLHLRGRCGADSPVL